MHTYICRCSHAMEYVSEDTHVKIGAQMQTNKSGFNVFCISHAPAAAEQRDFHLHTPLSYFLPPVFIPNTPLSAVGWHLSVPHRPAPFLHASANPDPPPLSLSPPPPPVSTATLAPLAVYSDPNPQDSPLKAWTLSQTS